MEINNRKSIWDNLRKYDYLLNKDDNTTIEVTEWTNGEGVSICIGDKSLELSYGELDAINYLVQSLKYFE